MGRILYFLILAAGLVMMTGCGSNHDASSGLNGDERPPASASFPSDPAAIFKSDNSDGRLRYIDESRMYRSHETQVTIRFGASVLKVQLASEVTFDFGSRGELMLIKEPRQNPGRLFKNDGDGELWVVPGERFEWGCSYEISAALKNSNEFELRLLSGSLDQKDSLEHIMALTRSSPLYPVQQGDVLGSLQAKCKSIFQEDIAEAIEQDLREAMRAKLTMTWRDARVQVLDDLAASRTAAVDIAGYRFTFYPPSVMYQGETMVVRGEYDLANGPWSRTHHSYTVHIDKKSLAVTSFSYYPSTNHPKFQLLREMERFISVNFVQLKQVQPLEAP